MSTLLLHCEGEKHSAGLYSTFISKIAQEPRRIAMAPPREDAVTGWSPPRAALPVAESQSKDLVRHP